MKRTILVFGGIAGIIVSLMLFIMTWIGMNHPAVMDWGMAIGYTSMLLAFSMIFVAIKSYRDRYCDGIISFRKSFLIGLAVATIASLVYVFTWLIMYKTMYPDYVQRYSEYVIGKMQAAGKTQAEISQAQKEMIQMFSWYDTWLGLIAITFIEIFPVGFIVALICALFLKRKVKQFSNSNRITI